MSSILRALKKLENEPRHLQETQPLHSKFVPLADTGPPKTAKGIIMMVIGGGIVCGLVILAGWWMFSEKNQLAPVVPPNISQQELKTTAPSAVAVEPAKPAADLAVPRETADNIPASTAAEPAPPAIASKQATQPAIQKPEAPSPEIIEQKPAEKIVAITRAPVVPAKVKKVEIPVLNDPEMKLQAITWSKDPQKRIAVINNRILRQGEVVYGYRIDTINQDDIVLSDAAKKWKLLFR